MRTHRLVTWFSLIAIVGTTACGGARAASPMDPVPAGERRSLRRLVLMLDGVPYTVVDSLWRAGHFADFRPPSKLISPFPALTEVAFGSIWHEPPPGYEDRYFDAQDNRIEGGLLEHLFKSSEHGGFRRYVDIGPGGVSATFAYVWPSAMARRELNRLRNQVLEQATRDTAIVAYMVATDAIAHRAGREALVEQLLAIEDFLGDLRARFGPQLEIVLFSDHGNELIPTRRAPLEEALEAAGFDLADEIEDENDVVAPRFGLVGSAFFYAAPSAESRLADALAGAEGVELAFFEDEDGRVHVRGRDGRAIVEARDGGTRFRYEPLEGDPLGLADAVASLRRRGLMGPDGFAADSAWFGATQRTPYIDSLRRIVAGLRRVVKHPANVVVSFAPGYHFGSRAADLLVDVTGTHGSLRTESALAFLMGTHLAAPTVLRSEALLEYLPVRPVETARAP